MVGVITGEGTVTEPHSEGRFWVEMPNGHRVLAHWSKKLRQDHIHLLPGDKVMLELSAYDLSRGRISHRQTAAGSGSHSVKGGNLSERLCRLSEKPQIERKRENHTLAASL